jgi:serine/threonine protein kinase
MMKMIERLPGKPSMNPPISPSTLGKRSLKRARTSAKVLFGKNNNIGLLEKNRHKRPTLEETMNHPWFAEFKDIHAMRQG